MTSEINNGVTSALRQAIADHYKAMGNQGADGTIAVEADEVITALVVVAMEFTNYHDPVMRRFITPHLHELIDACEAVAGTNEVPGHRLAKMQGRLLS